MWYEAETDIFIESRQVTQNLRHCCSYNGLCFIHACKHRFLCCWLVTDSLAYFRITTLITDGFVVPKNEIENSNLTTASLFFTKIFGNSGAVRGLNFLIALASFGNMIAVIIGLSRRIRECGRQGVLPWTEFWVSTKPFGTTLGPYAIIWFLTALMILAVPAGDAFTFSVFSFPFFFLFFFPSRQGQAGRSCNADTEIVNDLSVIPTAAFNLAMALGIYVVRWRRKRANLPEPEFKAWHVVILFNILIQLYLLVMPWYPPEGSQYAGDVSFWYATYAVTGIGM